MSEFSLSVPYLRDGRYLGASRGRACQNKKDTPDRGDVDSGGGRNRATATRPASRSA